MTALPLGLHPPVLHKEMASGLPRTATPSVVVISDFVEGWPPSAADISVRDAAAAWSDRLPHEQFAVAENVETARDKLEVVGGYLERLPLACVKAGTVDHAEIWHHWRGEGPGPFRREGPLLARRSFRLSGEQAPFASNDMLGFLKTVGVPHILCVYGLGVDPEILKACENSFKIYNSIDAPALRVPHEVSGLFDLVMTGAEWQSREVLARHPGMACANMPIGPEFADPRTFRPLGLRKDYDIIYVAAAQPYKRHDILFDALEQLPHSIRTLCVFGYGEMADDLRRRAADSGLDIDFVGPPGVPFDEVNRLMNSARMGVVCGVDDGAPAILTEYMLAGLPVLANARLSCGRQFILPETGALAEADQFAAAITAMLSNLDAFAPRQAVLDRWIWPITIERLKGYLAATE